MWVPHKEGYSLRRQAYIFIIIEITKHVKEWYNLEGEKETAVYWEMTEHR